MNISDKMADKLADDDKIHEINLRCVWTRMVTRGGCSSLNECTGTMGIPGINQTECSKL